jgi:pantoate--beta-alanine ligase
MIIYKQTLPLQNHLQKLRQSGNKIGFVPTMGALHKGHVSLIQQSNAVCDVTMCSIFVNPVQFNDMKDFEKYPVTIEQDIFLLEKEKTGILFMPSVEEIYPEGLEAKFSYDLGDLETLLEGFYRPGHFQGVCRVMHKLLDIVKPNDLFMGQKDYQQCMVVKKIIQTFNISTQLHIVSTQREENGLALSSRNLRLSQNAKHKANAIYTALNFIKTNLHSEPLQQLKTEASNIISNAGFEKIDYVEISDANTLQPVSDNNSDTKKVALAAAFIEGIRLIDNLPVN